MLSVSEVRAIISVANQAKTHYDYITANQAFVGLLFALLEGNIEEGYVHLEYENSYVGDDPYYDLPVLVAGNDDARLCIPRPLLALEAYVRFASHAVTVDRREHGRTHEDKKDCSSSLAQFNLFVPEGWLLSEQAPRSNWMTEGERMEFDWEFKKEVEQRKDAELTEKEEDLLYDIQDRLSSK